MENFHNEAFLLFLSNGSEYVFHHCVLYVADSSNSGVFGIFIPGQNKKLGSRIRNKVLYGQRDQNKRLFVHQRLLPFLQASAPLGTTFGKQTLMFREKA